MKETVNGLCKTLTGSGCLVGHFPDSKAYKGSTLQPNGGSGAIIVEDLPPTAHHQGLVYAGQIASIFYPTVIAS